MVDDKEFDEQVIKKGWFGYDDSELHNKAFEALKRDLYKSSTINKLLDMFQIVRKDQDKKTRQEALDGLYEKIYNRKGVCSCCTFKIAHMVDKMLGRKFGEELFKTKKELNK